MRTGISITITRSVRGRLEAITRDRNASQKHAWRAAIILSSADGVGTNEIMRFAGWIASKPAAIFRGPGSRLDQARDHFGLGRIDLTDGHGVEHGGERGGS